MREGCISEVNVENFTGKWIWFDGLQTKNQIGCFADEFFVEKLCDPILVKISAETKYEFYINGEFIGRGPIRSTIKRWYYDEYDIRKNLKLGKNYFACRVWDYGVSTYQTIWTKGGLIYDIIQKEKVISHSSKNTRSSRDLGLKHNTVKRNANLGYMENYDASKFDFNWIKSSKIASCFKDSVEIENHWGELTSHSLNQYHYEDVFPKQIISIKDVKQKSKNISIDTRSVFFPDKTDVNENTFEGFLGVIIHSGEDTTGTIVFPCRKWNAIIGNFKIDDVLYPITDKKREVEVQLKKGKQLFLMEISGRFDDLFSHIEFIFDIQIEFENINNDCTFFAIGPTSILKSRADGFGDIYGGLIEYSRLEKTTELHKKIFSSNSIDDIRKYSDIIKPIGKDNVFIDEYIYSNVRNSIEIEGYPIHNDDGGFLWNNTQSTVIEGTDGDTKKQIIIDFNDIYVGNIEFKIYAKENTIIDLYFYENMFDGEIDYTVGLNNSIRYISKKGYQHYRSISRIGGRYCVITINNADTIEILDFHIKSNSYATYNNAMFKSDNYLLNKIWEISRKTHLLCSEDTFTDCPTYEQAFWIGDAQISASVNAYLFGQYELIRHSLELVPLSKDNTPLLNALMPTDWNTAIPMWSMNWIISIDQYITCTADQSIIKELYEPVKDLLFYFSKFITDDGGFLINAWNMLDWAALDIHNHGIVTGQQAILCRCYEIGAAFAEKTNDNISEEKFKAFRKRLMSHIDEQLWIEEKQYFCDGWSPEHGYSKTVSIQTHTLLTLYNAIKDPKKKRIVDNYIDNPPEEFLKVGSPFFLFYIYEHLAMQGKIQNVLDDIVDKWGKMLRYDCTTCWEVFPGFYEAGRTRSYCHSWSSSPVYFINKYLLGVNIVKDGYESVEIYVPENNLKWCQGTLPSPHGNIQVYWSKENDERHYKITIPDVIDVSIRNDFNWDIKIKRIGDKQ